MDINVFLAAAAAVNRFVEVIKPLIKNRIAAPDIQEALIVLVATVAGIALALIAQLNIMPDVVHLNETFEVVLTGCVLGLGADAVNAIFGLFYTWKDSIGQKAQG